MSNSNIELNPGTGGNKLDTELVSVGGVPVDRVRQQIAGDVAAEIAEVQNSATAGTEYGLVTRSIVAQLPSALVGGKLDVNLGTASIALPITDNSGSLTVDSTQLPSALVGGRLDVVIGAALPAGTAYIGKVRLTDGTNDASLLTPGTYSTGITQPSKALPIIAMAHQLWPSGIGGDDKLYPQNMDSGGATLVNIAGLNGATGCNVGSGVASGSLRVVLANESFGPQTSGGLTMYKLITAGSLNAGVPKASAGQVYAISVQNTNAAWRYLKFYNKATTASVGSDTPVWVVAVPPNASVFEQFPFGLAFSTGIAIGTTTGSADNDNNAITAGDLIIGIASK